MATNVVSPIFSFLLLSPSLARREPRAFGNTPEPNEENTIVSESDAIYAVIEEMSSSKTMGYHTFVAPGAFDAKARELSTIRGAGGQRQPWPTGSKIFSNNEQFGAAKRQDALVVKRFLGQQGFYMPEDPHYNDLASDSPGSKCAETGWCRRASDAKKIEGGEDIRTATLYTSRYVTMCRCLYTRENQRHIRIGKASHQLLM
ncbi:hypothetical protein C8J56DRAFT_1019284 [Mycena floridula]|nr:hypothetical protein C8J56DRAFT_1019284 [Mycena floridula]